MKRMFRGHTRERLVNDNNKKHTHRQTTSTKTGYIKNAVPHFIPGKPGNEEQEMYFSSATLIK